jgi:hypothetical protein
LVNRGSEREVLEAFLDLYRGHEPATRLLLNDTGQLAPHHAALTTLAGIAKHLASVEREWRTHRRRRQ